MPCTASARRDGYASRRSIGRSDGAIEVADTGAGIEARASAPHLRSLLHDQDQPSARQHKGTGLGLAVSYGILQEHGGKISVESQSGEGTTFRLEIPGAAVSARRPRERNQTRLARTRQTSSSDLQDLPSMPVRCNRRTRTSQPHRGDAPAHHR